MEGKGDEGWRGEGRRCEGMGRSGVALYPGRKRNWAWIGS